MVRGPFEVGSARDLDPHESGPKSHWTTTGPNRHSAVRRDSHMTKPLSSSFILHTSIMTAQRLPSLSVRSLQGSWNQGIARITIREKWNIPNQTQRTAVLAVYKD